jgi:hypothetical protein
VETEMLMNKKERVMTEICDTDWLSDFELPCENRHQLNGLNTKFQVQQKPIQNMFWAVRSFEIKLRLFPKQVKNINLLSL